MFVDTLMCATEMMVHSSLCLLLTWLIMYIKVLKESSTYYNSEKYTITLLLDPNTHSKGSRVFVKAKPPLTLLTYSFCTHFHLLSH